MVSLKREEQNVSAFVCSSCSWIWKLDKMRPKNSMLQIIAPNYHSWSSVSGCSILTTVIFNYKRTHEISTAWRPSFLTDRRYIYLYTLSCNWTALLRFTASQLARKAKQTTQMEFLYQNGAEGSGNFPATISIRSVSDIFNNCFFLGSEGHWQRHNSATTCRYSNAL